MNLPATVSGRQVTNRGVHAQPFGFHGFWLPKADWWIGLMKSMHLSWLVVCAEGDSVTKAQPDLGGRSVAQALLDGGIIPVVRYQLKLNYPFPNMPDVEKLVGQCEPYGVEPVVLLGNEPGDPREWKDDRVPSDWFERYCAWFQQHSAGVVAAGAIAGFADGPTYSTDPFTLMPATWANWEAGRCIFAGHFYGLNRPPGYPYDSVAQTGLPLITEQELRDWFGPFYGDYGFNDFSASAINAARKTLAQPGLTAVEDATCYRGFERVQAWMIDHFGKTLGICMTEGGWTPMAWCDPRYPRPTPETVAGWTLEVFEDPDNPLIFQCPWLLANSFMGAAWSGWEYDSWVNGVWRDIYPDDLMPVVKTLQANPPGNQIIDYKQRTRAEVTQALSEIEQALEHLN